MAGLGARSLINYVIRHDPLDRAIQYNMRRGDHVRTVEIFHKVG